MTELSDLDLNLLSSLDALLSESNVTRAALRLGVTQPTMSRALQRLREQLGDELLVRSGRGLVRTARGDRIHLALGHGMQSLRRALSEEPEFVPESAQIMFRVAANDVAGVRLVPALMAFVGRLAPRISVNVIPLDYADMLAQFEHGALDVALGVSFMDAPGIKRRVLLRDGWVCLSRSGHPVGAAPELDLAAYLSCSHALCSPRGEGAGVVDEALARLGHARHIALRSRYLVGAALAVRCSDLLLTMPRKSGERLAELLGLCTHAPPAALSLPTVEFAAVWHERQDDAPAHRWFRQQLFRASDEDLARDSS
jgi:DNA-binding transcriptional LysR family regulator